MRNEQKYFAMTMLEYQDKLQGLSHDEQIKLLYNWVKQEYVKLRQFGALVDLIERGTK